MKIEIDTQRDSRDELKKLAKFLHELSDGVIHSNSGSGIFDNSNNTAANLLGIFSDDKNDNSTSDTTSSGILESVNDESDNDKNEKSPELELY